MARFVRRYFEAICVYVERLRLIMPTQPVSRRDPLGIGTLFIPHLQET
jgi:hypothetical protein